MTQQQQQQSQQAAGATAAPASGDAPAAPRRAQRASGRQQQDASALTQPLLVRVQVEEGDADQQGASAASAAGAATPHASSTPQSPGGSSLSSIWVAHPGATHWLLTTAIMLADMLGLGTLSLPADFARLGWLPGAACLTGCAAASVYAGHLYTRLTRAVPQAKVFDEIGLAAAGRLGQGLVFALIYVSIACQPVILHLTSAITLREAFHAYDLSDAAAYAIVAAIVLPLGQIRHMEDVALVGLVGIGGMLLAVAIVTCKLAAIWAAAEAPAPTELIAHGQGISSALVGVMDIVFSWGGQINWIRYVTTMRRRSDFPRSVAVTTAVMSVAYLAVAGAGYRALGTTIDLHKPVSSVLGRGGWMAAANAGILAHCLIAYTVNLNVLASLALHLTVPKYEQQLAHTRGGRLLYFAVTAVCIALGGSLAWAIPFFSLLLAVVAALGDVMSVVGLPAWFCIRLVSMPPWERRLCWCLLALSSVLAAAGVASSVQQLVQALGGGAG